MADGDPPLQAGRDRALGDVAKLRRAGLAEVVQMNVDALAERLGEAEDDVELALDVAVEARRIEAADRSAPAMSAAASRSGAPVSDVSRFAGRRRAECRSSRERPRAP